MTWLAFGFLLLLSLPAGVVGLKFKSQRTYDDDRKTYLITFPTDLAQDRVEAWMRAISGTLNNGIARITGTPTVTFETWATDTGIAHRLKVPWQSGDYIASQLRSLIPGISVEEDETRPRLKWTRAIELGMRSPSRQLRISNHADLAASLLSSVGELKPGEVVVLQWVLTPAPQQRVPARDNNPTSNDFTFTAALMGNRRASRDEIEDRRNKLDEQNLQGIGRIAAYAETEPRATHLVHRVEQSLAATRSNANGLRRELLLRPGRLIERINNASAPMLFPAQFSIKELSAVVAWPIGSPSVAGLPQGPTRHLYATEDVPRVGIQLGHSNWPGDERPIALAFHQAIHHVYYGGTTGSGKSTGMDNHFTQVVAKGYGGIIIDASSSDSSESLFSRGLGHIPADRLDDVIVMDVSRSLSNPVGFNVLDQGNPRAAAGRIAKLIRHLYPDTNSIWAKKLLAHGLAALAEHPGTTFADLMPLLDPATADETAWSEEIRRNVKDPVIRAFWKTWERQSDSQRATHLQPLDNRIWDLLISPEIRNMIGQSESSFKMADVLLDNKILLVSLAGVPVETASLMATILVDTLWEVAQTMTPDNPNFLYLDEFQLMTRLPMGLDDMLARARKHKLGVVLGTQYLEDLPNELRNAVINNARSRIIFQSSAKEGTTWQNEMGKNYVTQNDFQRIRKYEAIAQLATDSGIGAPVTLKALAPLPTTGMARRAVETSAAKYGRKLADVEAQMIARRKVEPGRTRRRPPIGVREWGE